ncbi:MAG: polyprenol monophosphomannose synthase [Myxococcales bacterium]|nr:polyprenol monophosphomannose synthase [Myxococcales bacterium]MCB9644114.1 polyprenol monophosphomannose synthase [Myxococcales bacterium]
MPTATPDTPPKTLIIIPTYNESENLPRLLDAIHQAIPHAHILVVDDNSPDGTGELAEERAQRDERIFVLRRPGKLGLGTAYLDGFRYGLERDYQLFQQMDCDFSHDPKDLPRFQEAIKEADLVLGSRYVHGGGTKNWPIRRKILSRGGSLYARTILGIHVRDLTGGFKCFRREVLESIDLDAVRSEGYSFQIETTWRTLQKGFRLKEIPILFVDREFGQSKMNPKIFREAVIMCWKLRLGLVK